jgi:hypothetical protein
LVVVVVIVPHPLSGYVSMVVTNWV